MWYNDSFWVRGGRNKLPVSVSGTGLSAGNAIRYMDKTWARSGANPIDGTDAYTAVAKDAYGRSDTNTVSVFLPVSTSFTYDLNGNLLSDGRRGFDYDDENQLIRVTITNATRSDFVYDGKMRRRERIECTWNGSAWVTNEIVHYIYDGNLVLQERHYSNPQLNALAQLITYTRGKDLSGSLQGAGGIGGLLARSEGGSTEPSHAYYHADGNGNVTCLINLKSALLAKYIYDPYGNIISSSGPLADANLYRFSSKEFHPQSGLVYYLYRYYEPNLQRWMNRDPLAVLQVGPGILEDDRLLGPWEAFTEYNGANLHHFCGNNPLDYFDAEGLCSNFKSQWPSALQKVGETVNGKPYPKLPGKATALGALRACKDSCVAVYGAAAENADDECESCEKKCLKDCKENFDKAIGKVKTK